MKGKNNKSKNTDKELQKYRNRIDQIDKQIAKLLIKRLEEVISIGKYKKENGINIRCKKRENEVIANVIKLSNTKKIKNILKIIYKKIILMSKSIEK